MSTNLYAQEQTKGRLNIEETDGSPSTFPYKLIVGTGALTDNGDGTSTLSTGGAPTDANYLTSTANSTLANEVDLGSLSTGLLKGTVAGGVSTISSVTDSSANWDTAYTDRLKWDGGATGLTAATGRTSLGLVIGTDVQAYDADLTTWAGITPGANVGTFLATPSSANLLAAITDETGTGLAVFSTSPTFTNQITTPKIVSAGDMTLDAVNAAANSTVYVTNSNGTYTADLNVEGDLVVTDVTVSTGGTLQLGQNGTDGLLKIYSEQGATDYIASLYANTAMTSAASFYLPADEPAGTYLLNMTTGGIIGYDSSAYLATAAIDTSAELAAIVGDETGSGALVFGTSPTFTTSIIIPNGANPTTDAAGKIAIDTSETSGSAIRFYGDAAYSLPAWQRMSFTITNPTSTADRAIGSFPANITIRQIRVLTVDGTNIIGGLDECDANGLNAVAVDADITGTAGTVATDDASLTNPTIDANDQLFWHTTSVSGAVTKVVITVYFTYDQVN